ACMAGALVGLARSSKPPRATTSRKPPTTRGCMLLKSHSIIRRLRSYEPVRWTRKRSASGTSHLAVMNSLCTHGLQVPFSAQPKAMSRLARKIRSRFETSISLILYVTSIPFYVTSIPPIGLGSHVEAPLGRQPKASSQTLAEGLILSTSPGAPKKLLIVGSATLAG